MARNAYNLPPPWDAGYALPKNVKDEGLENRGFVTKMLPRGTYDNPSVGTGGYAVPKYVRDEGYGQGTFVTKWLPRGTAPNVPVYLDRRPTLAKQTSLGPGKGARLSFSGTDAAVASGQQHPLFTEFGRKAAQAILVRIAPITGQAERTKTFNQILMTIDKTLPARINALVARGVSMPNALAQALSSGYANEIVQAGVTRRAPQPGSLLGLGAYSRGSTALGAADGAVPAPIQVTLIPGYSWAPEANGVAAHWQRTSRGMTDAPGPIGASVSVGTAQGGVATLSPGYSWVPAAGSVPGHWERTPAGKSDTPGPIGAGSASVTVNDQRTSDSTAGGTASGINAWAANAANGQGVFVQAGQWMFPENGGKVTITKVPPDRWSSWLAKQLTATSARAAMFAKDKYGDSGAVSIPGYVVGKPGTKLNVFPAQIGRPTSGGFNISIPIYTTQHPTKNEKWGVYLSKPTETSYDLEFKKVPTGTGLWSWIEDIASYIYNAVKDVVEAIADLACKAASSPLAPVAGAVAGTVAGVGPVAGTAGVGIAKAACSDGASAPPPLIESSNLVPIMIGVGVLGVAVVMLSKKKKHS